MKTEKEIRKEIKSLEVAVENVYKARGLKKPIIIVTYISALKWVLKDLEKEKTK